MDETRRMLRTGEGPDRSRALADLETVALALGPDRWSALQDHLSDTLWSRPREAEPARSIGNRRTRLAAFAQLVRSARELRSPTPGSGEPLSRSELRIMSWTAPHLYLLCHAPGGIGPDTVVRALESGLRTKDRGMDQASNAAAG